MPVTKRLRILSILCLLFLPGALRAQRSIPDDNLSYPVLIQLPDGKASGFFLNTANSVYLVTAKHVLFTPPTGSPPKPQLRSPITLLSYARDPKESGTNLMLVYRVRYDLQRARRRFHMAFRRFISVFARPEHPLALFLDDLQWLDPATLDLIEDVLSEPDVSHLMFIGAYRDNEVDGTHPLMRKLEAIRQRGAIVHDIVLAPLAREDLEQFVRAALTA